MNVLCETPQVLIRVQTTPLRFPDGAGVCGSEGGKGLCFMSAIMNLRVALVPVLCLLLI